MALGYMQSIISRSQIDRKSTRLNSSHSQISYAVFCLKKKNNDILATILSIIITTKLGNLIHEADSTNYLLLLLLPLADINNTHFYTTVITSYTITYHE